MSATYWLRWPADKSPRTCSLRKVSRTPPEGRASSSAATDSVDASIHLGKEARDHAGSLILRRRNTRHSLPMPLGWVGRPVAGSVPPKDSSRSLLRPVLGPSPASVRWNTRCRPESNVVSRGGFASADERYARNDHRHPRHPLATRLLCAEPGIPRPHPPRYRRGRPNSKTDSRRTASAITPGILR